MARGFKDSLVTKDKYHRFGLGNLLTREPILGILFSTQLSKDIGGYFKILSVVFSEINLRGNINLVGFFNYSFLRDRER